MQPELEPEPSAPLAPTATTAAVAAMMMTTVGLPLT